MRPAEARGPAAARQDRRQSYHAAGAGVKEAVAKMPKNIF